MIKRKTVFVIGAGAHCPYNFPDGAALIKSIIKMLPANPNENNEFRQEFFQAYGQEIGGIGKILVEFRRMLDLGGHSSIDSFLATHARFGGYPEVGKFAVAKCLLPLEFKASFSRTQKVISESNPDRDWLSYLFNYMSQGCLNSADEFIENNKSTFVTFNYDRTLEYFFYHRFQHTYGLSPAEALEKAKQIPIIHVYGSLGDFHSGVVKTSFTPIEIQSASACIRLMYEDRLQQPEIEKAKAAISDAAAVCFLGFSFDPDNIVRLEFPKVCKGSGLVMACRYMMPEGDWGRAMENMLPVQFNMKAPDRTWDALTFLRETRALG
jgi:hypothetical protein